MSVVEDTRKVLQDFLAPELREVKGKLEGIEARISALEGKFDARIDALDDKSNARFSALESSLSARIDALDDKTGARFSVLDDKLDTMREEMARRFDENTRRFDENTRRFDDLTTKINTLLNVHVIEERLARLEQQRSN